MTDEEYQKLFPWTAYKQVHTRGGRTVRAFEERLLPTEFQIGTARFVFFVQSGYRPRYKADSGLVLSLYVPMYKGEYIQTPAYWVASTNEMCAASTRQRHTPMQALAALQADLLEIVTKGQQAQKSYDTIFSILGGK